MKQLVFILFLATLGAEAQEVKTTYYCFGITDENAENVLSSVASLGFVRGEVTSFGTPDVHFIQDMNQEISQEELMTMRSINGVSFVSPMFETQKGDKITYTDQILVKLEDVSDLSILEMEAARLNLEIVEPNRFDPRLIKVKITSPEQDTKELSDLLKASGLFHHVQPNYLHTLKDCAVTVNDPMFERQWQMLNTGTPLQGNGTPGADMNVTLAWDISMGSADIKIAILDSGVDTLHPDLIDRLEPGFDAAADSTNGYPTPNYMEDGHGTCCAGIAAATADNNIGIAGVAPNCRIIPIRVFYYIDLGGIQPWAEGQWFVDGINYAWQVANADVASNSWGVPDALLALFPGDDLLVNEAIADAVEMGRGGLGMPLLFSSGNDGINDTIPIWPARLENTIAVGATSMCDEHKSPTSCDGENWWAGNWGNHLDVSAPGVRIPSTDMMGPNGFSNNEYFNTFNGTSAACPNAAGVVALILSQHNNMSVEEVSSVLKQSCAKVGGYDYSTSTENGSWSAKLGHGRVDALAALELAPVLGLENEITKDEPLRVFASGDGIMTLISDLDAPASIQIEIIDVQGRILSSALFQVASGKQKNILNNLQMPVGMYLINATWNGGRQTLKIVR